MADRQQAGFLVDDLYHPKVDRSMRQLPRLLVGAFKLVWSAARRLLVLNIGLQAVSSIALAIQVLVGKDLLTKLLADNKTKDFTSAVPVIAVLAAVIAVVSVTTILRTELQRLLSEMVSRMATQQVIYAASISDLADFEDSAFHDRLQRAIVNATIRPLQMTIGLLAVGGSALGACAVGAALVSIEPLFFAIGVLGAVPLTVSSLRVGRALYRFAVQQTPVDRERTYIQQLLVERSSAKEVRSYQLGVYLRERFARLYAMRLAALRRLVIRRAIQGAAGGTLTAVVSGGALGLLVLFVSDGRVSLAGAGAAAAALLLLGTQLQGLASGMGQLYESALFIQDFNNFVSVAPLALAASGPVEETGPAPIDIGHLSVQGLSFTYPNREQPSLVDINLDIAPGEVIALVGENGSGKTTLAKLLVGLYPPGAGRINWDGHDISKLSPVEVQTRTAVLFQDFVKYFLTARENVTMGRWQNAGDDEALKSAIQQSGSAQIFRDLPHGYETYLGPQFFGGSDLSGGQWQRVALARALFREAELIVLDEPTAALDPRAEAALFGTIREVFAGKSVIFISHRFATVHMADRIYVLDQGRVAEHGTHRQLMAEHGLYAELFELQSVTFGSKLPPTTQA